MPVRVRSGVLLNAEGWTPFIEIDGQAYGVGDGPCATEAEAERIAHEIHEALKQRLVADGGMFIDNNTGEVGTVNSEQLVTVLRVACLTEDRDRDEQRAMLALALDLDRERGQVGSNNRNPHEPELVTLVEATYDPSADDRITLTAAQRGQYDRLLAQWRRCDKCKHPMGAHYLHDACPSTPGDLAWLARHGL